MIDEEKKDLLIDLLARMKRPYSMFTLDKEDIEYIISLIEKDLADKSSLTEGGL